MAAAVVTRGLEKRYGRGRAAVSDLDLVVPLGSVFGFLGPNGSGKTTTLRALLGLVKPSAGEVEVLGRPMPRAAREVLPRVGALVEGPAFHPYLTGAANLARLDAADPAASARTSRTRICTALERVGLTSAAAVRFRTYSLGMKQRLGIAAALLAPRDLLVLDEPTNGLDPQGTREVRALVRSLNADGTTVLLSSHLLSEVEQVCTDVAVMRAGRLVAAGRLDEIGAAAERAVVLTVDAPRAASVLAAAGLEDVRTTAGADGTSEVSARRGDAAPEALARALVEAGVGLRGFEVARPTLEDTFVALTGEGFDVER